MSIWFNEKLFTRTVTATDEIVLEGNVLRLADGSLFLTWTGDGPREPHEDNVTYFSRSQDNGRTWDEKTILFSHPRKGIFTPEIFTYKNKIFAFPCSYYNDTAFAQDCNSYISVSSDCGKTFSPPSSIGNALNNIHVKGNLIMGNRIILSCSWIECTEACWAPLEGNKKCIVAGKEFAGPYTGLHHQEYCGVLISDDGGETWRIRGKIGEKGVIHVEPTIVELSDGSLKMLIRRHPEHRLYESHSLDQGETWSPAVPTEIPSAITKSALIKDKDGTIYLLHNPNTNRVRSPLSLWISNDDMKTWEQKIELVRSDAGEPLCYPDGFVDEERGVLCFSWDDRKHIYYSEYPIR